MLPKFCGSGVPLVAPSWAARQHHVVGGDGSGVLDGVGGLHGRAVEARERGRDHQPHDAARSRADGGAGCDVQLPPEVDVADVAADIVKHVETPRPVRVDTVKDRQQLRIRIWTNRSRSREGVPSSEVARLVGARGIERAVSQSAGRRVVERVGVVNEIRAAASIGHQQQLLTTRTDEQYVYVVGERVVHVLQRDGYLADRTNHAGDVNSRRVWCGRTGGCARSAPE